MSATNWTIYPKCYQDKSDKDKVLAKNLTRDYGLISEDKWVERKDSWRRQRATVIEPTLREDYAIGVNLFGGFKVQYECFCTVCKFNYGFEKEVSIAETKG